MRSGSDRTLFDTAVGNLSGGSGRAFDWNRIADRRDLPRAFLAGGIGAHNARAALEVGAFGLDVGSAMEARPRHKDPEKMRLLFEALRPACRMSVQCA